MFDGMPVIRSGDNVFIINNMPPRDEHEQMLKRMRHLGMRFDEYHCPFEFMDEFDQWIEWKIREYGHGESTGVIITDMLGPDDLERIEKHKKPKPIRVMSDYGPLFRPNRSFILTGSV